MKALGKIIILFVFCLHGLLEAKPFVTAKLVGQLGNQMFQIATATSLALDHGVEAVFPDLDESEEYGIPTNRMHVFPHIKSKLPGIIRKKYYDHTCSYHKIPYESNIELIGWFQSEKYFKHHREEILELFEPSDEIYNYLTTKYEDILNHPCTVSIHHRSYAKEDPFQYLHPTQPKEYFLQAINQYPHDSLFIVCSNDIEWCKWNFFDIPREFIFIEDEPYYHDLYLMSLCKHNIISNSSFSWWSAWLNKNPDKIVTAPKQWFTITSRQDFSDIVPKDWIKIDPPKKANPRP